LAQDPATGQLVLFGGYNGTTGLDKTWTWNGTTWTTQPINSTPAARYFASAASDPATNQLVLFGGYNGTSYFNDTWIHG
jgi:hypothetical protein